MGSKISTDVDALLETVRLAETMSQDKVAETLGITRSGVQHRLRRAAAMGLLNRKQYTFPQPPGFALSKVTTLLGKDGEVNGQWVQAKPEGQRFEDTLEAIEERLAGMAIKPVQKLPGPRTPLDDDLLSVYMLADHHMGMFSWARETGSNYDTSIAWELLERAMTDLVANSPPAGTGLILNLGDFFHADDDTARTRRSGNALDVDTRFARVLSMGIDLTILTIQLALQKHKRVIYRGLAGNHDPYASLALSLAVSKFFAKEPRVTVDTDPGYFFVMQWGECMICATHGDMTKPDDVVAVMAARWPKIWGETRWRYAYLGHVHSINKGAKEGKGGAVWETFQSLAARDSWHSASGYGASRSMTAVTLHKHQGERFRTVRSLTTKETE